MTLTEAIKQNKQKDFFEILNLKTDLSGKRIIDEIDPEHGGNPLHVATAYGHLHFIVPLIEAGIDVDQPDNDGWTAVYIAADKGYAEIITELKAANADVDKPNNDGAAPVHVAAENGHIAAITALGAANAKMDTLDNDGFTSLYIAVEMGDVAVVSALLETGANAGIKTPRGSLLERAKKGTKPEHAKIVSLLETHLKKYSNGIKTQIVANAKLAEKACQSAEGFMAETFAYDNPDVEAKTGRDFIATIEDVKEQGEMTIGCGNNSSSGVDTFINNRIYTRHKPVLERETLDPKEARALAQLKASYLEPEYTTITGIFGSPLQLEGQYINLQMLCLGFNNKEMEEDELKDAAEEKCIGEENKLKQEKKLKDERMASVEDLFGDKHTIKAEDLFKPVHELFDKKEQQAVSQEEDKPPRLLLVQGRAGIGKTTFVHYAGHQWSRGQLYTNYTWVFTLTLRKLRLLPNTEELNLAEWVRQSQFNNWSQKEFGLFWKQRIEPAMNQNKVLLILDGYDEIPEKHPCKSILKDLLTSVGIYENLSLLITTRPCSAMDINENRRNLEIIGFTDENIKQYIETYFSKNPNKKLLYTLAETLRKQPVIWANAHIPLNLNLLCGIMEEAIKKAPSVGLEPTLAQLSSMSCLYQIMEKKLYERSHSRYDAGSLKMGSRLIRMQTDFIEYYQEERFFLAKLAFESFEAERIIIPLQTLGHVLEAYVDKKVTQGSRRSVQQEKEKLAEDFFDSVCRLGLIKPVLDKSGLPQTEQDYEFLHLTFQEYYTAIYLAKGLSSEESQVKTDAQKVILKEKYNPRWQIVWWFVAGFLKENTPVYESYLQQLQGRSNNQTLTQDIFGHYRSGLLTRCVDEGLQPNNQEVIEPIIKQLQIHFLTLYQIAKNLTSHSKDKWELKQNLKNLALTKSPFFSASKISSNLFMSEKQDLYALIPEVHGSQDKYFFLAWVASTRIATPKVLRILTQLLTDTDSEVRRYATWVVSPLGIAAVTPQILDALIRLLVERDRNIRRAALTTFSQLGEAVLTGKFFDSLTKLLADRDTEVRCYAARAVDKLDIVATPEIIAALMKLWADLASNPAVDILGASTLELLNVLLVNKKYILYSSARNVVSNQNAAVATPESFDMFNKLLVNGSRDVRRAAASAVGNLDRAAVTPQILDALTRLLSDRESNIRFSALEAINKLGVTAEPKIQNVIAKLLTDKDYGMRDFSAEAVVKLNIGAHPNFIDALINLLTDTNIDVRRYAVEAAGKLDTAVMPRISDALTRLFANQNKEVRRYAAEAVCKLKVVAITPPFIDAFTMLLIDPDRDVRHSAIQAVNKLGTAAITPQTLDALAQLLADEHRDIRLSAIGAIGKVGAVAATPHILGALAQLFTDQDWEVRRSVAQTVGELGAAAVTPQMLLALGRLLAGKNCDRYSVAETVRKLSTAAAPHFFNVLMELLENTQNDVRRYAAAVAGELNTAVIPPQMLDVLTKLLADIESGVRSYAVIALSRLGSVVTPQIADALARLSMDEDINVRCSVAQAINNLHMTAAEPQFLGALTRLLADTESNVRRYAAEGAGNLNAAVVTPQMLDALAQLLTDENKDVRRYALEAAGKLSTAAATPKMLNALVRLLADQDRNKYGGSPCSYAAEAVGKLGTKAATPEIVSALVRLLVDENKYVRRYALGAVGKLGTAAATSEILDTLARLLANESGDDKDENSEARRYAAQVVGELSPAAATPQILGVLVPLLRDRDWNVRCSAEEAIGKLTVSTPSFLGVLIALLMHANSDSRRYAVEAIGKLGASALTTPILNLLFRLLTDENSDVRRYAIETIHKLGAAAEPKILDMLVRLLVDKDWSVRGSASSTIVKLDIPAIPQILEGLAQLLVDGNREVRRYAAEATGTLGAAAAKPQILDALARLLADENSGVRRSAAEAVGKLGALAGKPPILSALTRLLFDESSEVRGSAVETVGKLGAVAAIPQILDALGRLLADKSSGGYLYYSRSVCCSAAEAISKMGLAAATPEILESLACLLASADKEYSERQFIMERFATEAIDKLSAVAMPQVLDVLTSLCADKNSKMRSSAAKMVVKLGATTTPQISSALVKLLTDTESSMRCYGAEAIGSLGTTVATPQILDALAKLLADKDSNVRLSALEALGNLGTAAATSQILDALAKRLVDKESSVRLHAVNAVGKLNTTAATPQILDALAKLLAGKDSNVCLPALEVLGNLGPAAATEQIFRALGKLLVKMGWHWDPLLRALGKLLGKASSVTGVIEKLVIVAPMPEVLDALMKLLTCVEEGASYSAIKSRDECRSAIQVLRELGEVAVTPPFLKALAMLLVNKDRKIRLDAREAVLQLSVTAMPKFLPALLDIFTDKNNVLNVFETCIESIFPLFPSFWLENAHHSHMVAFVSHILAASYLNSHISCQLDFDKDNHSNGYYMKGFVEKSSYCFSITSAQAQWLNCLSLLVVEQLSKTGRLDITKLKARMPKWEEIEITQTWLLGGSANIFSHSENVIAHFSGEFANSFTLEQRNPPMLAQYHQTITSMPEVILKLPGQPLKAGEQSEPNQGARVLGMDIG